MKRSHWTLLAVIVVCRAPSAVWAQGPGHPALPPVNGGVGVDGRTNIPPGVLVPLPVVPKFPDREKRRDEQDLWKHAHFLGHLFPHGTHHPGGPSAAERGANVHTPATVRGAATARGFWRWRGGGILAGIGAAIAGALGGIFGRKKES